MMPMLVLPNLKNTNLTLIPEFQDPVLENEEQLMKSIYTMAKKVSDYSPAAKQAVDNIAVTGE